MKEGLDAGRLTTRRYFLTGCVVSIGGAFLVGAAVPEAASPDEMEIEDMGQEIPASPPEKRRPMDRAALEGIKLEYEVGGAGEPVILIHAGICAEWFKPLFKEPALARRYRLIRYHRAGYAGSGRLSGPVSIAQHAAHCRLLMRHLGLRRAHVVGHSSSGNIALQLALESPEMVRSLALLEPALLIVPSPPQVAQAIELYRWRQGKGRRCLSNWNLWSGVPCLTGEGDPRGVRPGRG